MPGKGLLDQLGRNILEQTVPGNATSADFGPDDGLAFNQHKDYAQRNLTYVRAELRGLQLIRQPAKLAIVDIKGA